MPLKRLHYLQAEVELCQSQFQAARYESDAFAESLAAVALGHELPAVLSPSLSIRQSLLDLLA